jgi:hypothetical protein
MEANSHGLVYYLLDYPLLERRLHESSGTNTMSFGQWDFTHEKIVNFIDGLGLGFRTETIRTWYAEGYKIHVFFELFLVKLRRREISMKEIIKEYREKKNALQTLGMTIPFRTKVRWFLQYMVLPQKWYLSVQRWYHSLKKKGVTWLS